MAGAKTSTNKAEPFDLRFNPTATALKIIEIRRDLLLPGGFGRDYGERVWKVKPAKSP